MNPPIMRGYASIKQVGRLWSNWNGDLVTIQPACKAIKELGDDQCEARMSASTASPRVHTTLREEQGKQEPLGAAMQKGMGHVLPACSSPFLILAIWKADGGESSIRELPITEA